MKDTGSEVKTVRALSPQSDSGGSAVNGAAIDRMGYDSLVATVITGAISGSPTTTSMAVKVQHCDTSGGTYADVTDATATITAADSVAEINVDCRALKRYVRVTETTTFSGGSTPAVLVGGTIALGQPSVGPAA